MVFRQMLEMYDLLDRPDASGAAVCNLLRERGAEDARWERVEGARGATDCVKVVIPGRCGAAVGGAAPTLGIIGRLGGIGARPSVVGAVSDGDGAVAALTAALKLAEMARLGDCLQGDVIVATHVCPDAPTLPHDPVPFMDSPIDMAEMNRREVDPRMDAVLSIDTTRGNRLVNVNGIALTPTVKEGAILPVAPDLLAVYERVTGSAPVVLPLAQQDITPYGNGLRHVNSIVQPATATVAPVVGVALTAREAVAGCATGASQGASIEQAARFAVEVAKDFTAGASPFYDADEYRLLVELYGSQSAFRTMGRAAHAS